MNALYKAVLVATILSAIGFIPVTMAFDNGTFASATSTSRRSSASSSRSCSSRSPSTTRARAGTRQVDREASQTGHATNIIEGLAVGMQATALPVIVIAPASSSRHHFAGLYGIGVAVMAQLSMTGLIVALDAYGP
jgi:K(+)-stimulated pyrophosphate-energized sodium pump